MPETFPYKENLSYTLEGYACKVFIINQNLILLPITLLDAFQKEQI